MLKVLSIVKANKFSMVLRCHYLLAASYIGKHMAMHIKVGKSACIVLQNESQKCPSLRYIPLYVLELLIIFYAEMNKLCLGALQICD